MNILKWEDIQEHGVLKWNIPEDITNIQEQNYKCDEKKSTLEKIYPPREWTSHNDEYGTKLWRQTISRELPTKGNLSKMIQTLKDYERDFAIRNKGICESRNALYNLFFDELLRQIIIRDEEVGIIIYRIHKEFENLISIYKYILEKDPVYDVDLDIPIEDHPEVESLMKINEDLIQKCEKASLKYLESLRQRELNESVQHLAWLERIRKNELFQMKKTTEKLQEQLDILSVPATLTPLT